MKERLLFIGALLLVLLLVSCSSNVKRTDDVDKFDEFAIRLDEIAGSVDLGLDIDYSDLTVDDVEMALTYLNMYIDGDGVPIKKVRDSIKYLERFVKEINHETWELNKMFQEMF